MNEPVERGLPQKQYQFSLVACARWEHRDIAEWLLYHRSVGFDHVFLYSNDDDPTAMLQAILPIMICSPDFITFKHFPKCSPDAPQQHEIYRHFLDTYQPQTEWFSLLDIDEFFVFKGVNNVVEFMRPFDAIADAVYFNWLLFGHSGKIERDNESLLLSHTQRASSADIHTKILTRSSKVNTDKVLNGYYQLELGFWHFWHGFDKETFRQVNVLGDPMETYAVDFPDRALDYLTPDISARLTVKAYIAHFQFRSEADVVRRVERGGSNAVPYWDDIWKNGAYRSMLKDRNKCWDVYLAAYWLKITGDAYNVRLPSKIESHAVNIALRKPTFQSSSYRNNIPCGRAFSQGHVTKGWRSNTYGIRSNYEHKPWIVID